MSGIFRPSACACDTKRLAWKSCREEAHFSVKSSEWEGFNIRVHRARIQDTVFHLLNQVVCAKGFDLHMSDGSKIRKDSFESQSDSVITATGGDIGKFFGTIHIVHFTPKNVFKE